MTEGIGGGAIFLVIVARDGGGRAIPLSSVVNFKRLPGGCIFRDESVVLRSLTFCFTCKRVRALTFAAWAVGAELVAESLLYGCVVPINNFN